MPALEPSKRSAADVLALARKLASTDVYNEGSRRWGGIYHDSKTAEGRELEELQGEVLKTFASTNALYPGMWASVARFESELVQFALELQHGQVAGAVGLLASGGTEAILLAILSYREWGKRRGVTDPEVIAAMTAHPALDKACFYFGVRLIKVPVGSDLRMSLADAEAAITPSTVAIYASAPSFAHGVMDDIEALSDLVTSPEHAGRIGIHVDNCLGGVLLSHLCALGLCTRRWDFELPGVHTISMDVHKYGYAGKGVSTVTFRSSELRRAGLHPVVNLSGGFYVTPTLQGSRNGASIASAWATIKYMGAEGYLTSARRLAETLDGMRAAVAGIDGLEMLCDPDLCILPFKATDPRLSLAKLTKAMDARGWSLFTAQNPPCISVCLGDQHTALWRDWARDLAECASDVLAAAGSADAAAANVATASEAEISGPYSAIPMQLTEENQRMMAERLKDYVERQYPPASSLQKTVATSSKL